MREVSRLEAIKAANNVTNPVGTAPSVVTEAAATLAATPATAALLTDIAFDDDGKGRKTNMVNKF